MINIKKIIFLHNINHYYDFLSIEKQLYPDLTKKIISLSLELRILLKFENKKVGIEEDYIDEAQAQKLDDIALSMAKEWHKNYFKFLEISLGELSQYNLNWDFATKMRKIHLILNVIETEKPSIIVSFDDNNSYVTEFNEILKYIGLNKKIQVEIIPSHKSYPINIFNYNTIKKKITPLFQNIQNLKPFKFVIKKLYLLLLTLDKFKAQILNKHYKNILTYEYTYHYSIIEHLSRENNIFLLEDQPDLLKYKELLKNLKNLIILRKRFCYIYLEAFESKKVKKSTDFYFDNSINLWKKFIKDISFSEMFHYNNLSMWPLFKELIYKVIFYEFKQHIKNLLLIYNFLKKEKYNLIVLSNDVTEISKILAIVSSKINIPSLVIQHGLTSSRPIGYIPSFSSKIAVWGKISKETLIEHGLDNKKIVITGSPRFDLYTKLVKNEISKKSIKRNVYNDFKIKEDKKLIVATSIQANLYRRFSSIDINLLEIEKSYEVTLNTVKNLSDSHLIIKLHPWDSLGPNILLEIIKRDNIKNVSIIQNYNIVDLICACDCFITEESTTGIEAMLMNKPVFFIGFRKNCYYTPYFEYFPDLIVSTYEALLTKIQNCFKSKKQVENYKKFLEDCLYKIDGLSTQRVLDLINFLISNS